MPCSISAYRRSRASIYTTWLQRSSLGGAAQLALVALLFVLALVVAERAARGRGQYHHTTGRYRSIPFSDLEGWRGYAAAGFCAVPVLAGFVAPFGILLVQATAHVSDALQAGFWSAVRNSIGVSIVAAVATVTLGLALAYARRVAPNVFVRFAVRGAGLGYALPGTVLALGLLIPLAGFDNAVDAWMRHWIGVPVGLLLSGSLFVVVLAYVIRFLAVSLSALEAGFERLSPNLDAAARTLGETALSALWRVHIPLLVPALGAAALLVFVDAMKELPATLLLRPFNFETLATHVYAYAGLEMFENATLGCPHHRRHRPRAGASPASGGSRRQGRRRVRFRMASPGLSPRQDMTARPLSALPVAARPSTSSVTRSHAPARQRERCVLISPARTSEQAWRNS